MFIYRIETDDGIGCYRFMNDFPFLQEHNEDIEHHPTPYNDTGILRGMEEGEICGFTSLTKLKKWFTLQEIKLLRADGFTIKKVEVINITAYGEKQVLAIRVPPLYEFVNCDENGDIIKEHIGETNNASRT